MGSQPRGISASRGAAILGLSEWSTPFEVWQEIQEERSPGFNARKGYTLPERKDSAPLRWGTAFEDSVITLSENARGCSIIDREKLFFKDMSEDDPNIQHPAIRPESCYVTCHIDGRHVDDVRTLHEGKTTSAFPFREKWGEPGTSRIPQTYAIQVQHQMACTGAEMDIVSVLVFPETPDHFEKLGWKPVLGADGYELCRDDEHQWPWFWARALAEMGYFHQYPVPADRDAQKLLLDAYRHFWDHYVIGEKEPEPRDYDDLKRMFPEPKKTIVCPSNIQSLLAEMKSIKEEIGGSGPLAKKFDQDKLVVLKWAFSQERIEDEDSLDALIFRDQAGNKLASYSRDKRGTYTFRAS